MAILFGCVLRGVGAQPQCRISDNMMHGGRSCPRVGHEQNRVARAVSIERMSDVSMGGPPTCFLFGRRDTPPRTGKLRALGRAVDIGDRCAAASPVSLFLPPSSPLRAVCWLGGEA